MKLNCFLSGFIALKGSGLITRELNPLFIPKASIIWALQIFPKPINRVWHPNYHPQEHITPRLFPKTSSSIDFTAYINYKNKEQQYSLLTSLYELLFSVLNNNYQLFVLEQVCRECSMLVVSIALEGKQELLKHTFSHEQENLHLLQKQFFQDLIILLVKLSKSSKQLPSSAHLESN